MTVHAKFTIYAKNYIKIDDNYKKDCSLSRMVKIEDLKFKFISYLNVCGFFVRVYFLDPNKW